MNEETSIIENNKSITLKSEDNNSLTVLVEEQIGKLNELDERVQSAVNAAENAREKAKIAESKSAGIFKKKEAIEELQQAGIELSEAVQSGAEAQEVSFEFQTKLADISKALFGLGVSNIANNRTIIRQLELRLKGASEEELSDLAKQEIIMVVKQLKEQEDILKKQENTMNILKSHNEQLEHHQNELRSIDNSLNDQAQTNKAHNKQLQEHAKTNEAHNKQLQEHSKINEAYNEQLQEHAKINEVHNEQLQEHAKTNEAHNKQLQEHAKINEVHNEQLQEHAKTNEAHNKQLQEHAKTNEAHNEQLQEHSKINEVHNAQLEEHAVKLYSHVEQINLQGEEIAILKGEITHLQEELDKKTSKIFANSSLGITLVTFVLVIIHFFI